MRIHIALPEKANTNLHINVADNYLTLEHESSDLIHKIKENIQQISNALIIAQEKTHTESVSKATPHGKVKTKAKIPIKLENLILMYDGQILDDNRSIEDYHIYEGAVVYLYYSHQRVKAEINTNDKERLKALQSPSINEIIKNFNVREKEHTKRTQTGDLYYFRGILTKK